MSADQTEKSCKMTWFIMRTKLCQLILFIWIQSKVPKRIKLNKHHIPFKMKQAWLSRATLEISSEFSSNFPLSCSYLPHQLGSLSLRLAVARAAHSMPLEISHLVSDWVLILFFSTDFFLVRLPLEVVFISRSFDFGLVS